jgi:hypothetical protein
VGYQKVAFGFVTSLTRQIKRSNIPVTDAWCLSVVYFKAEAEKNALQSEKISVEQEKAGLREELLQVEREKLDIETEKSGK